MRTVRSGRGKVAAAAYAKSSLRAEKRALREKMLSAGLGYGDVAVEFGRRYQVRPRAAWREAHGWSLKEAAERINAFRGDIGLDPGGLASMTAPHLCERENWPGLGAEPVGRKPTPRQLAVLAAVYGCAVLDLVDMFDREHLPPADLLVLDGYRGDLPPQPAALIRSGPALAEPGARPVPEQGAAAAHVGDPAHGRFRVLQPFPEAPTLSGPAVSPAFAYRGMQEPGPGSSWVEREVLMTAHEGSEHAEQAERREIGDATLEQIRADVTRLSADYMTAEPLRVFREMRAVRDRIYSALDRQLWPRDQTEFYFMLAVLAVLMAAAADDLGYPQSGEELIRSGWAYATAIGHQPLMGYLRLGLARIVWWDRPRQARDLTQSGLRFLLDGPNASYLHLESGRAAARLGDTAAARAAITAANEARVREHHDELLEIGGEFSFSQATQHYMAGSVAFEAKAETLAIEELERATGLYAAGPGPGELYGFGCVALSRVDLAAAQLRAGQFEAAAAALEPTLTVVPSQRIMSIPQRLTRVRAELAAPRYRGSPQASELDERIEAFSRDTIVEDLRDLPAGSG
jgi:hypothetical protein